jgi:hypothetical protein
MLRRPVLLVAALAAMVPLLAACGGGSKNAAEPLPKTPTLTVPGDKATPSVPKRSQTSSTITSTSTTSSSTTPATTTQANPSTPQGGAAPPQTGGATPTQTSTSQSGGTPAQRFEQFCKDNPGAC